MPNPDTFEGDEYGPNDRWDLDDARGWEDDQEREYALWDAEDATDADLALALREGDLLAPLDTIETFALRRPAQTYTRWVPAYRWVEGCLCDGHGRGPHRCRRIDWEQSRYVEVVDPGNDGAYAFGPRERGTASSDASTLSPSEVYSFDPGVDHDEPDPAERRTAAQQMAAHHREGRLNRLADLISAYRAFEKPEAAVYAVQERYLGEWAGVRDGDSARNDVRLAAVAKHAAAARHAKTGIVDLWGRLQEQEEQEEARLRDSLGERGYWLLQMHRAGKPLKQWQAAEALGCSIKTISVTEKKLRSMGLISGPRRDGARGPDQKTRSTPRKAAPVTVIRLSESPYAEAG